MRQEYLLPPCSGKSIDILKGQSIAIIDIDGGQVVDFFAECAGDPNEFLSTGVTIDCNESLRLSVGGCIYSNLYRSMFQIVSDDVGEHDLLHPCCRPEMYRMFAASWRNPTSLPQANSKSCGCAADINV